MTGLGEGSAAVTLTICICAMDRAEVLRRCLSSIAGSTEKPDAVLVSDDSREGDAVFEICRSFPDVTYIRGARAGLCANRNWVIRHAVTTHVSLMDDDAVLTEDFVAVAKRLAAASTNNTIITGTVLEGSAQIAPRNPSFLGHFRRQPTRRFESINLNCNIIPRAAFEAAEFDPNIVYGYEDMDLCAHLLSLGYRIEFAPELRNEHRPPARTAKMARQHYLKRERARFYTSVKRYMLWQRKPLSLLAYILLAPIHRAFSSLRRGLWFDLKYCVPDMVAAVRQALSERTSLKRLEANKRNHAPLSSRT